MPKISKCFYFCYFPIYRVSDKFFALASFYRYKKKKEKNYAGNLWKVKILITSMFVYKENKRKGKVIETEREIIKHRTEKH